ncbi:flagellar hook-length control protein FliK [Paraglaciecola aestuariivivens]
MMQQVATALSDIAAFATGGEANANSNSDTQAQFTKMLQEQSQSQLDKVSKPPRATQTPEPVDTKSAPDLAQAGAIKSSNSSTDAQALAAEQGQQQAEQLDESSLSKNLDTQVHEDKPVTSSKENLSSDKSAQTANELKIVAEQKAETLALSSAEAEQVQESSQTWFDLVEKLQQLAAKVSEQPEQNKELEQNISLTQLAVDTMPELEHADPLLAQLTPNQQKLAAEDIATEDIAAVPTQAQNEVLPITDKVKIDTQSLALMQEGISTILSQLPSNQGEQPSQEQVLEKLLAQPDLLAAMLKQMNELKQQSDPSMSNRATQTEQAPLLASVKQFEQAPDIKLQQLNKAVPIAELDLTKADTQALLKELLTEPNKPAGNQGGDQTLVADKSAALPNKLGLETKTHLQVEQQVESKAQQSLDNGQKSAVNQVIAAEQTLELNAAAEALKPTVKPSIQPTKTPSDLAQIAQLPETKLNKVLAHIAAQLSQDKDSAEALSPQMQAQQLSVSNVAEGHVKEFISVLKTGVEEFKQQMAKGREPGLDLKTLVSDALAKIADPVSANKVAPNVEQVTQSVSQLVDFAQSLSRAMDQRQDHSYQAMVKDVGQVQAEQSKQLHLNQLDTKLDKAINITKPEGHQQLAEKVRWMVNTRNLVAEIRLDPAELGSVQVKVAMSGETATVNFVVQSQHARDAVDTATPRLKEMLAEKGIELGQSSVQQEDNGQSPDEQGELAHGANSAMPDEAEAESNEQLVAQQSIVNGALGGIDYFV